jgi:hypothetical protein
MRVVWWCECRVASSVHQRSRRRWCSSSGSGGGGSHFCRQKAKKRDNFLCFFCTRCLSAGNEKCLCLCVFVCVCVRVYKARAVQRNNDARSKQRERFDFGFTDTLNCVFFSLVFLQHLFSLSLSLSLSLLC